LVQGLALLRRLDPALLSGNRRYRPREWAAATLPMGFADLTLILFNSIDVIVLGLFVSADAVGVYFAATRILQLVLFAQYAATAATAPRFAEASARGDDAALRALVRGTVRLTAGASLALGAGLLLVAPWLLDLFGAGFGAGFGALAILVCGAAVQSSFGPAEDLLNMLGAERVARRPRPRGDAHFRADPVLRHHRRGCRHGARDRGARRGAVGRGAEAARPLDPHPGVTRP